MLTIYGTPWYSDAAYSEVYYSLADGSGPDQARPFGEVWKGEVFEILGVTDAEPDAQWVKFLRYNSDTPPVPATLWMKRQVNNYGRKQGTWFAHCVELKTTAPFLPASLSPAGTPWAGVAVVSVPTQLYKDSALSMVLRQTVPGQVIPYDSETSAVIRSWYQSGGVDNKCYFQRQHLLASAFLDGTWYEQFILFDTESPVAWSSVPVLGAVIPPPPVDPPVEPPVPGTLEARVTALEGKAKAIKDFLASLEILLVEMRK